MRVLTSAMLQILFALSAAAQLCPGGDPINRCAEQEGCFSPIVLNLGAGAYQLSGPEDPVTFDINADGVKERISWTAAGAPMAFLALDRNGNGKIDDGSELFGDHTPLRTDVAAQNGFEALAQYDSNSDGVIDANDAVWSSLLLWTDSNHDGISQLSEIMSLSASAVVVFGLNYHQAGRRDVSGNQFRYKSAVWLRGQASKPTPRPVYDIFFLAAP